MSKLSVRSLIKPLGWLATSGLVLFGLINIGPGLGISTAVAIALCVATIIVLSFHDDEKEHMAVPYLSAGLFACLTWIAFCLMPAASNETQIVFGNDMMARILVALISGILAMPLIAVSELVCSAGIVQTMVGWKGDAFVGSKLQTVPVKFR